MLCTYWGQFQKVAGAQEKSVMWTPALKKQIHFTKMDQNKASSH